MNIKITKEEHERLQSLVMGTYVFGSHLYGTNTESSDKDLLHFIPADFTTGSEIAYNTYPCIHQFQYDDLENNEQHIYTTQRQFTRNLISGDSGVNLDVAMFHKKFPFEQLFTYKIVKSILGFAKRDVKNGKKFHAMRNIFYAYCMLEKSELPGLKGLKMIHDTHDHLYQYDKKEVTEQILSFRNKLNELYNRGEIPTYWVPKVDDDSLLKKLLDSNNIREFRYD